MKTVTLIILLFIPFASPLIGQPYYFTHYQVEQGLSNNAVLCSLQDQYGFMWFGTKDGLNRFDGYSFKTYRYSDEEKENPGSNFIHALYEHDGLIYIGSELGLYFFDPHSEEFSLVEKTENMLVRKITGHDKSGILFIGGATLYQYDAASRKVSLYSPKLHDNITSMCITRRGVLWVSTHDGLIAKHHHPVDSFTFYDVFLHSPPSLNKHIETVYSTQEGQILVGTSKQGLKSFDPQTETYRDIITHTDLGVPVFVRNITEYGHNTFWVSTENGVLIYQESDNTITNLKKDHADPWSLSDNAIYTITIDKENGLWIGTYFGGINYYTKSNSFFTKFFPSNDEHAISGHAVREICPDKYGNLWIGTEDAGLNKFNPRLNTFKHYKPSFHSSSIANTNIHALLATGDTLWIGTFENGLTLMDIHRGKVFRTYTESNTSGQLQNNFFLSILKLSTGKILLASAFGLHEYDINTKKFSIITEVPTTLFYSTAYEDSEDNIWVGTSRDGLFLIPSHGKSSPTLSQNNGSSNQLLGNNRINCIFEDSDKTIWVTTENGLYRLGDSFGHYKKYTTEDGLPGNLLYNILEDDHKRLWITSSKGLVRFDLKTEAIKVFTKANGLLSDQFNYNSAYKDPDGNMYFGSVKGLIRFHPDDHQESAYQPPVYITGFQVYHQELEINAPNSPLTSSIAFTEKIKLRHNQSSFSIDFAALSYISPEMTEYAYKMEGLDRAWTHIRTNRKAYFTELPPGKYVFRVNVTNGKGEFKGKETNLHIEIMPPFRASTPAYILYIILIGLAVWYAIWSYDQRMKEKNRRRLERIRNLKEKALYRAKIDFFTNVAHDIRTPLTLIKAPLEKILKHTGQIPGIKHHLHTMQRNTERLITLSSELLDFRKVESDGFRLNFSSVHINRLLHDNCEPFKLTARQRQLKMILDIPAKSIIASVDEEAINKITNNLLNNALKYSNKYIYVSLEQHLQEESFSITVKNDGQLIPKEMSDKIFEPFYRLRQTVNYPGTGLGLALSRSLAELHNGTLILSEPEGNLNIFVLTLPIHQNSLAHDNQ